MENYNSTDEKQIPSFLNVLTILTFIGAAYELFTDIKNCFSGDTIIAKMEDARAKMTDDGPAFAKKILSDEALQLVRESYANRWPLLVINLIGICLCVYGAILMRKLKKDGYTLWIIGELFPFIGLIIFTGTIYFQTIYWVFMIFPVLFIIFYSTQQKYLE
jgi:hypothetical protein